MMKTFIEQIIVYFSIIVIINTNLKAENNLNIQLIQCQNIATKSEADKCLEIIKQLENNKNYSGDKNKLLELKNNALKIKEEKESSYIVLIRNKLLELKNNVLKIKDEYPISFYISIGIIVIILLGHLLRLRCPKCKSTDFTEIKSTEHFKGFKRYIKTKKGGKTVYESDGIHSTRGKNEKVEKIYTVTTTYKCNKCGEIFTHDTEKVVDDSK